MEERLRKAHMFAIAAHGKQERKFTGEPYTDHLEQTAQLLWDATNGKASNDEYVAALLHDVVEDTDITKEEVGRNFGGDVMGLVVELTINNEEKEAEGKKVYLTRKLNAMTESALTIKFCDRLSNVLGLQDARIPIKFVRWYVKETNYILEHLERELTGTQKYLAKRIEKMLLYLKLNRGF